MAPWIWIVAAVAAFALLGDGNPVEGIVTAIATVTRGPRLTHSPADDEGFVAADPQALADEAGLSLEAYALARMIASEEAQSTTTTQAAIAHATINKARRSGKGIAELLLRAKNPANNGHFGTQRDLDPDSPNFNGSDRFASTRTDPYDRDGQIALQCLAGTIPDFTGGATNYDRPAGEKHPDQVAADRGAEGLVLSDVEGADDGLRFWRPA